MKFFDKLKPIMVPAGFALVGILMFLISMSILHAQNTYDGKTTATIVNIEQSVEWTGSADNETAETVYTQYITYRVNGVKYENVDFGQCDESTKVGDKIEILYDSKDPSKITSTDTNSSKIGMIAGAGFFVVGIALSVLKLRKLKA